MSINQLFELSRRSFRAFDASMKATSQNVANAETEGYRRRRVNLQADSTSSSGIYTAPGPGTANGNGVSVASYERVRDRLLDNAAAGAQTGQGAAQEEARILGVVEGHLKTGTEGALPQVMENFWDSWNTLANNPDDGGVRSTVLSRARSLSATFESMREGIGGLIGQTQQALRDGVDGFNERLDEVAALNETIGAARANGSPDLVAEDRRDTLVKELSALAPVDVQEDAAAGYTLTVDGMSVVQGNVTTPLRREGAQVFFGDTDTRFRPPAEGGGEIGAQVRLLSSGDGAAETSLQAMQSSLDDLAQEVAAQVNAAHEAGADQNGDTGEPFFAFDGDPPTASNLELAVDGPSDIAASAAGASGDTGPARAIAALSETLTGKAIDFSAAVGAKVQRASAQAESQGALADHLEGMARGVSGVSIDEEMTNLIQQQQSFAASARVLNTAQSLMDTLLRM